ncbi:hypothetical protein B5S30_g2940 [[Candida] boidinii]|nr:hypothetical protein B5S27_g4455 [[Candida] boidinii]OWB67578.1 hypothetical protein B5S30_g2940 [[Candida] boidinii]
MSSKIRILVPVKRVIDAALKPRINKTQTGVESKGVKFIENIHAVSIGPSKAQDVLRTALAKGVDDSTLIDVGEKQVEPLQVSKILKKIVEKQNSNLVILGKQSIDDDSNQTGQMLAGLLNWPQATNASKVVVEGDKIRVTREIDGGAETVEAKLPMIITTDLRLNEPKFVTLPKMMKAKKKPLAVVKPEELDITIEDKLEYIKLEEPPARKAGVRVNSVDELVAKLKELKAI